MQGVSKPDGAITVGWGLEPGVRVLIVRQRRDAADFNSLMINFTKKCCIATRQALRQRLSVSWKRCSRHSQHESCDADDFTHLNSL